MTKEQELQHAIARHKVANRDVMESTIAVDQAWRELDRLLKIMYWDKDERDAAKSEIARLKKELGYETDS